MPQEVIDESLAKILIQVAKILAGNMHVSKTEIELWIKHIGPAWKRDPSWMKQALCNWYRERQDAGLAPAGENEMEKFIRRGLSGQV